MKECQINDFQHWMNIPRSLITTGHPAYHIVSTISRSIEHKRRKADHNSNLIKVVLLLQCIEKHVPPTFLPGFFFIPFLQFPFVPGFNI